MEASTSRYSYSRGRMHSSALPSPPSPAASSPTLTQSASNSSSSPPQPTTPPRQPRPRYPDLGRVPLHRRGTSQTYERLEDLLREAGYKETRIFTPESDKHGVGGRDGEDGDSHQPGGKKQGVGAAVVGFLTGLVSGGGNAAGTGACNMGGDDTASESMRHQPDNNPDQRPRISLTHSPPSPLANKSSSSQVLPRDGSRSAESSAPQTPFMTSSIESLNDDTPKAYRRQNSYSYAHSHSRPPSRPTTPSPAYHQPHAPPTTTAPSYQPPQYHRLSAAQRQLQRQASRSSINTYSSNAYPNSHNNHNNNTAAATLFINNNSNTPYDQGTGNIHNPCPSRAGTHLRHMVSTPTIPPTRPNSTPAHRIRESSSDRGKVPPLPRNWLDNVARAILFGVASTGSSTISFSPPPPPVPPPSNPYNHSTRTLRPTRSSLSQTTLSRTTTTKGRRSGLSDQTNFVSNAPSLTPVLFTRLERGRASCSQGDVLKAQVVCRSAPGSRASSVVRSCDQHQHQHQHKSGSRRPSSSSLSSRKRHYHGNAKDEGGGHRGRNTTTTKRTKKNPKKHKSSKPVTSSEKTRVPSLARTHVENDGWANTGSRSSTTALSSSSPSSPATSDDEEEEEEGEGELTLAKMLIHPKRQQSIRSLRKLHLQFNTTTTTTSPSIILSDDTIPSSSSSSSLTTMTRRPSLRTSSSSTTLRPPPQSAPVVPGARIVSGRLSGTQEEPSNDNYSDSSSFTTRSRTGPNTKPKSRLSLPQPGTWGDAR